MLRKINLYLMFLWYWDWSVYFLPCMFFYCCVQFCFFSPLTATTSLTSLLLNCQSITNLPVSMKKNTWKSNKHKVMLSVSITRCGHLSDLQLWAEWPLHLHDDCSNMSLTWKLIDRNTKIHASTAKNFLMLVKWYRNITSLPSVSDRENWKFTGYI